MFLTVDRLTVEVEIWMREDGVKPPSWRASPLWQCQQWYRVLRTRRTPQRLH